MAFNVRPYAVIGLSGVTNGGKTSLCERLMKKFPGSQYINMDTYFREPDDEKINIIPELNYPNYEELCSVDFESLIKDVTTWTRNAEEASEHGQVVPTLFIDGILIYNYKPLVPFYDKKYFLTLTKEQCWERRRHRTYVPPDPPGYYEMICWPMYLKNKQEIQDQKDLIYLDGAAPQDETFQQLYSEISAYIHQKKKT